VKQAPPRCEYLVHPEATQIAQHFFPFKGIKAEGATKLACCDQIIHLNVLMVFQSINGLFGAGLVFRHVIFQYYKRAIVW
jgi:hypothetical protein